MKKNKPEIITFKVDANLMALMKGIQNRSEFIRAAILTALDGACPLCKGAGVLTPNQKEHWDAFARDHPVRECADCHELHLICSVESE
jgi:hypothetical protein